MAETITAEQLQEMREEGDELEIHDNGHRTIEGFTGLVAQIKELVAAQRANAAADMLRSETQTEIIDALQKLLLRPAGGLDMTPLVEMITQMQEMNEARPRAAYEFEIDRDGQGFMRKITAKPIAPTIN